MKLTDEGIGGNTAFPASNGWMIPPSNSLSAFRSRLGITESNYSSYGLRDEYWSSTTRTEERYSIGVGVIRTTYISYMSFSKGKILETVNGNRATRWMTIF